MSQSLTPAGSLYRQLKESRETQTNSKTEEIKRKKDGASKAELLFDNTLRQAQSVLLNQHRLGVATPSKTLEPSIRGWQAVQPKATSSAIHPYQSGVWAGPAPPSSAPLCWS
ncbi:hypothetical protein EYF80_005648 [Liparis tanakae]|uniref:Uncharacterized protein n=1 Tax=Liparis tanakae TaxID=230148 RepID=A0A4Z2J3M4_9TELE|nr:hypothetical protein EYF80_005648 [Liparis tanakae]